MYRNVFNLKVKGLWQGPSNLLVHSIEHTVENKISYHAGQFLTIVIDINSKELRRCYSLCSSPRCDSEMQVAIKKVENELVSKWLPDGLRTGDTLKVMAAAGHSR